MTDFDVTETNELKTALAQLKSCQQSHENLEAELTKEKSVSDALQRLANKLNETVDKKEAEFDKLEQSHADLKKELESVWKSFDKCHASHADLEVDINEMIKVIEFYAEHTNWLTIMATYGEKLSGEKARAYLKTLEEE